MDYLEWPSNYVARCAVTIYEAAGGSLGWHNSGTVGELHMRPLGDGMINFQLHDLLDGQMLFEHTLRKPEALTVPVQQFFVIRQDNGSFRGFGFSNKSSALEMKDRVEKAVQPYSIGSNPFCSNTEQPITESASRNSSAAVVSYRTVPRRSSSRRLTNKASWPSFPNFCWSSCRNSHWLVFDFNLHTLPGAYEGSGGCYEDQRGQPATNTLPIQRGTLLSTGGQPKKSRRLWRVGKAVKVVSQLFDVKHVAHIGWDGPSIDGPGWMDEVKPAPNFSAAPLCDFGDPHGPDWFIDASSAAKWSASYGSPENRGLPPTPPEEYLQQFPEGSRTSKQREQKLWQRSKAASHWPQEH